jgi:hypothetical protein
MCKDREDRVHVETNDQTKLKLIKRQGPQDYLYHLWPHLIRPTSGPRRVSVFAVPW